MLFRSKQYIVLAVIASWGAIGREFNAPSYIYDYQNDQIVREFAPHVQSVSAALLDNNKRVLLGSGGQPYVSGQPNIMYDVAFDDNESGNSKNKPPLGKLGLVESKTQLIEGMSMEYQFPFVEVPRTPVATLPAEGYSKTRQVRAFWVEGFDTDLVLEINAGQTCNILCRPNDYSCASKIIQLPGSEGVQLPDGDYILARAGDILEANGTLHVIIASFNGNNTVYSFSTDYLKP